MATRLRVSRLRVPRSRSIASPPGTRAGRLRMPRAGGMGIHLAMAAVGAFTVASAVVVGGVVAGSVVSVIVVSAGGSVMAAVLAAVTGLAFGGGDGVEAAEGGEEGVEDGHIYWCWSYGGWVAVLFLALGFCAFWVWVSGVRFWVG
ncbi:hypothetical protein B0J18DRAFT_436740 [Chaetomium sp. MPI-SDFR-AT-0129]|nr:hypothetical protein B0J18DRAFT_436740 [Chaetomium sp. MPI-SDFR-AT-0129]